jgi:hypothetical protein
MQTIIAPARLKWRLTSGNGSHHDHGGGMMTTKQLTPDHHHHLHQQHDDGVEAKLAYTACLDALKTLMEYLRREMGIQLHVRPDEEDLLVILQRAHDYCYQMDQQHGTTLLLLLSCWKSVYTYTAVAHGRSWRQFQHSKHFATTTSSTADTTSSANTTSSTTAGGGEKNKKLHNDHHHPIAVHHHHLHTNKNAATRLHQALQQTIRYAEDCSTCQRQVYILQRKCCQDDQIMPQPPPPPQSPAPEEEEEEEGDEDDDVDR